MLSHFSPRSLVVALAVVLIMALGSGMGAQPRDPVEALLLGVESALASGDRKAFLALTTLAPDDETLSPFLDRWFSPATTRVSVHERDRIGVGTGETRLTLEVLIEQGFESRLATWRVDLNAGARITAVSTLSVVEGLFRLSLDETRQFRARNLVVTAEDIEIRLDDGVVFFAHATSGPTAAVLIGDGEMVFSPSPLSEQRQIALLTGSASLRQPFSAAVVRFHPSEVARRFPVTALTDMTPSSRDLARARAIFLEEVGKSYSVDLADHSRETWSLLPTLGNLLAEIRTRRFGTLTYATDSSDEEDISLFDRQRRRNLSIYSSAGRLSLRGPFYSEDTRTEFDVLDYNVETSFVPERFWMEGRTRLKVRIRAVALGALTLRLAEGLVVRSVTSDMHGRLLHIRVRNQNSVVVNLPEQVSRDQELTLTVTYAGRHEPQGLNRENLAVAATQVSGMEASFVEPEPHYLYSNRSYWYAQAPQSDYATATIRFTVPASHSAVCSGEQAEGSPVLLRAGPDQDPRRLHVFTATAPIRYLSCVVSRFGATDPRDVVVGDRRVPMSMTSTARQRGRGREVLSRAAEMMTFFGGIVGDVPYPTMSLAVVESQVPGGHAPGYMALVNQPLPTSPFVWRDDPASFDDFPDFFIAHEVAHQWWGQAVGWKNYHEQWLSEGFSQYFAALYAEKSRGPGVFAAIVRQLARWTVSQSDQGPVYLGYRLGHLKGDGRIFRALVYNKGAAVLHMLRRMLGDEAFFAGVRQYYHEYRYTKAGTEDLRKALEQASGRSLQSFFDFWIYGQDVPSLDVKWKVASDQTRVKIELTQSPDAVAEFPVTVTRTYADGTTDEETIVVSDQVTTLDRPVKGRLRTVEINRDRFTPLKR
jgi:hypothetical protein